MVKHLPFKKNDESSSLFLSMCKCRSTVKITVFQTVDMSSILITCFKEKNVKKIR